MGPCCSRKNASDNTGCCGRVEKLIANVFKNGVDTYGAMLSWAPPRSAGGLSILSHRVYVSSGTDGVGGVWDAGRDATSLKFYTTVGDE